MKRPEYRILDEAAVADALGRLPGWSAADGRLRKTYRFRDFPEAIGFIVSLVADCERLAHHPEIAQVYDRVSFALTTHDAGDRLTAHDLALAEAIERRAAGRS
jgi:4a-hydroxytetrahydrobiopterin dehydratase